MMGLCYAIAFSILAPRETVLLLRYSMMPVPEDQQRVRVIPPPKKMNGLAVLLEGSKEIRKHALNTESLLKWVAPNRVGVVTNASIKLNADVLQHVLEVWCPVAPDRKTVPVGSVKTEAFGGKGTVMDSYKLQVLF